MSDIDIYSRYFSVGMKVGVGIPLPNANVFRDWAIIHEIDEDFVALQLSRDQLPVGVTLHVGQILELRGGKEGSGYNCRAIIVSEGSAREILLRLIGEIVSDELREFYRIDAFLPIKYYLSVEQKSEVLQKEWAARREIRHAEEVGRKAKAWDSAYMAESGELPPERRQEQPDDEEYDEAWDTIIPLAANISGGGIRLITHQRFESGTYVLVEILVPMPRRIVDVVACVINANRNYAAGKDREYYNTGLKFVYIDERDRDAIINYISNVQLKRIRQLREQFVFRDGKAAKEETEKLPGANWALIGRRAFFTVLFVVIVTILFNYFRNYSQNHPKSEIEEIFEGGLKKYLEKFK